MSARKKTIWLPFFGPDNRFFNDRFSQIQLNPLSSIYKSESKSHARMAITAATLMAVMAVILLGNSWVMKQQQNQEVGAEIVLRQSLRGRVEVVDYAGNVFTLKPGATLDPMIRNSGVGSWKVTLPPGESFSAKTETLNVCFSLPDLDRPYQGLTPADCSRIIKPGKEIIVQYVIIKPESRSMVARAIYGTP